MSELTESKFFKQALGVVEEAPKVEEPETPKVEPEVVEPLTPEVTAEPETPKVEPEVVDETPVETYDEWFEKNESKLKEYLTEKSTDYSTLSPEDVLFKKYSEDNPDLSPEDVQSLLDDDFSLSESKIEIDTEEMLPEEIKAAEAHNKDIDKKLRKLKAEAKKAVKEFESRKSTLEKPVYKVPEVKAKAEDSVEKYTEDEIVQRYAAAQEEQAKEWSDNVEQNVKPGEKYSYQGIEVELSTDDHVLIKDAILNYVPKPGDDKIYTDGKGNVLWDKLTADVAKTVLLDKLIEKAKDLGKKERDKSLINYQDPTKNDALPSHTPSERENSASLWKKMAGKE